MSYAVLFPGQGSQSVGMCADVRSARRDLVGATASRILGWDLDRLIDEGPEEALLETQHAQPALYVTSFALWSEFCDAVATPPVAAAGHSLGEYTALAAAGVLTYEDGLDLVARRGLAMADAAARTSSGMAALLGADLQTAEEVAAFRRDDGGALYVANVNAPGQIVVAGGAEDLEWLAAHAREHGIRRAIILKVAGGFHSPFMAPAAETLIEALAMADMDAPRFDVYANVSAKPTDDPRRTLGEQLTSPVRFSQTLEAIAEVGIDTFVHIGPGDVTAGLAKRTVPNASVHVVSSVDQAREVASSLSVQ